MVQAKLLADRRFWPLFWSQFLGAFTDNFLKNALVILISYRAQAVMGLSPSIMVTLCGGIFILPFFLFSATAGQLADRLEKSILIRWIKFIEIFIMILAGVGFVMHQMPLLIASLFLMGVHSTFFGPIKYSIIPQLLNSEEMVAGNALVETGTFLAILLGTMAGGIFIAINPGGPWIVAGLLIFAAVLGWSASFFISKSGVQDKSIRVQWNPIPPTIEILKLTARVKTVFLAVLGISWFWFFGAAFLSLFPSYCHDVLGANEHVVTFFLATFSVGIGIGSALCEKLSFRRLELGLVPLGSFGMTLFTWLLACIGAPFAHFEGLPAMTLREFLASSEGRQIIFCLLGVAISSGFFIVPLYTFIQQRAAPTERSRVVAGNNIINALLMVLASILLALFIAIGLSIPQIFAIVALLNAAVAIYIYTVLPEYILRLVAWFLSHFMYRLRAEGLENIPNDGAAVLVCNHVSFVDWFIISAAVQRPIRFVMDHHFAKIPVIRFLFRHAKVIPIAPVKEDPETLRRAFDQIALELQNGELVCIFPEGFITRDGNLLPFRKGIEKILERSPVPVVPMALIGMWGSYFSRKKQGPEISEALVRPFRRILAPVLLKCTKPVSPKKATALYLQEVVQGLIDETGSPAH